MFIDLLLEHRKSVISFFILFCFLSHADQIFSEEEVLKVVVENDSYQMAIPDEYRFRFRINGMQGCVEQDSFLRQRIEEEKNDPALWNALGVVNYRAGRLTAAESAILKAIEIKPNYALAWRNMAVFEWDNGNWQKAMEYAGKASGFEHSPVNLYYVARAYILAANNCEDIEKKFRLLKQAEIYYSKIDRKSPQLLKIIEHLDRMISMRQ